jgi:hypothetical protein
MVLHQLPHFGITNGCHPCVALRRPAVSLRAPKNIVPFVCNLFSPLNSNSAWEEWEAGTYSGGLFLPLERTVAPCQSTYEVGIGNPCMDLPRSFSTGFFSKKAWATGIGFGQSEARNSLDRQQSLSGAYSAPDLTTKEGFPMNKPTKSLVFAAAVSGLLGGTTARLQAQPSGSTNNRVTVSQGSKAGVRLVSQLSDQDTGKHSCKGKNDCKGQGGCKTSDNGCKGKNSCKGKGGCATDGSKPPSVV